MKQGATYRMKLLLVFAILGAASLEASAQLRDTILLDETTLRRPLTLHRGQLRTTGTFNLGFNLYRFNASGTRDNMLQSGTSSVQEELQLMMGFGLTDVLQLNFGFNYINLTDRGQGVYHYYVFEGRRIAESTITRYRGLDDPYVGADYRIPFSGNQHDWVISGGAYLPIVPHNPLQPSVSLSNVADISTAYDDYEANYVYKNRNGHGVTQFKLQSTVKVRFDKTAVTLNGGYRFTPFDGKTIIWDFERRQDADSSVEYRSRPTSYRLSNYLNAGVMVERQVFPWVNVFASYNGQYSIGGWSEVTYARLTAPASRLHNVAVGYEILISHKLWLRQSIVTGVAGQSSRAPITLSTTLLYNFWPGDL